MGASEEDTVLMRRIGNGVRYYVEFDSGGGRIECYDGLDAIRRLLNGAGPGRFLIRDDRVGYMQTVGVKDSNGDYRRDPSFVRYGDDGVTRVDGDE